MWPALKRRINFAISFRSAEEHLLPHKCGGSHPFEPIEIHVEGIIETRRGSLNRRCQLRWSKSSEQHGRISSAEVLRLRATNAALRDKFVRRSAQDDGFVGILTKTS